MKSVEQILYEYYDYHDKWKIKRLLANKRYDDIEEMLGLRKGTISLYLREYNRYIKEIFTKNEEFVV
jgi:hypothetical protein